MRSFSLNHFTILLLISPSILIEMVFVVCEVPEYRQAGSVHSFLLILQASNKHDFIQKFGHTWLCANIYCCLIKTVSVFSLRSFFSFFFFILFFFYDCFVLILVVRRAEIILSVYCDSVCFVVFFFFFLQCTRMTRHDIKKSCYCRWYF